MYIDRMVNLIEKICASAKLSKTEKSDALGETVYSILCQGEIDGIEYGDSNQRFHRLIPTSEEKDKTIIVRKEMLEGAQRLNQILCNTRIKWDGSDVKAEDIRSLQAELERRAIVVNE